MSTVTDSLAADYRALTEQVGLVDRSERGKLALTGGEAKEFLHGQVTQDIEALSPGTAPTRRSSPTRARCSATCACSTSATSCGSTPSGSALQELFNMIRRYKLGRDVELHKRTVERALLSLVGPGARDAASRSARPSTTTRARSCGIACRHRRRRRHDLRRGARRRGQGARWACREVGEAVAEIVRVEHGRPRYGIDLDDSVIPQEAGLNERAVSFTKGCYVGQETVARLYYRGKPNRHLRGLRLSEPVATGEPLRLGEREVGRVGTSVVSPAHGPIALALVRREAAPGDTVAAGEAARHRRRAAVHGYSAASTPRARRRRRPSGRARRPPPRPPARRARSPSSACGRGGRTRARAARGTRPPSPPVRCAPPAPSRASRRPPCCRRPSIPPRRTSFVRPHPGAPPSAL